MGFFDSILRGLGFESEEKAPKEKKKVKSKTGEFSFEEEKLVPEMKPKNQEEVTKCVDLLKKEGAVLVLLDNLDESEKISALNFLSGAMYALNGEISKQNENAYKLLVD